MIRSNPLRRAAHVIPVAALSLLLLTAGMCRQAEEPPAPAEATPAAEVPPPAEPAGTAGAANAEQEALAAERAAAEAEERERQAAIAAAERELAEREARLAEEEARLRRERELRAEQDRLAAERAAAAERERQLAARERELRQQEAVLAERQAELDSQETIVIEPAPEAPAQPPLSEAAPEPLPEPTGSYEGEFDEPWRQTQEQAEAAPPPTTRASVQAGERLEVQILDTLSSETARVGERFATRLVHDLRDASGAVVIPAGAEVIGRVTEAAPYRRGGGPATLAVEFTDIAVSAEQTVGIRASFVELGADRRKNRKKVVAGAVVGAILGHILGGDGSKNVIIGAAAGAAAGGAVVASAKDRDAEIPAGQIIALELEEVVTVEIEYGPVNPG